MEQETQSDIKYIRLQTKLKENETELAKRCMEVDELTKLLEDINHDKDLLSLPATATAVPSDIEPVVKADVDSEARRMPGAVEVASRVASKRHELGFELDDNDEEALVAHDRKIRGPTGNTHFLKVFCLQ